MAQENIPELVAMQEAKMKQIQQTVNACTRQLIDMWNISFGFTKCLEHLDKLHSLFKEQFSGIVEESEEKHTYSDNQEIFELYAEWKTLWDRMTALEVKATDPARYKNRGGYLLKEEKERKKIASKLPKIQIQITELVHKYEECQHTPFLVHGENIIELIAREWEKKRQKREEHTNARKTPRQKSKLATTRTSMSLKNASAAFFRRSAGAAKKKTALKSLPTITPAMRRKSGGQSGIIKKRPSLKQTGKTTRRSSMIQIDACSLASRAGRQSCANKENERLMHQAITRIIRIKSRQNSPDNHSCANSPNTTTPGGSRSFTTKNLPIII